MVISLSDELCEIKDLAANGVMRIKKHQEVIDKLNEPSIPGASSYSPRGMAPLDLLSPSQSMLRAIMHASGRKLTKGSFIEVIHHYR